MEPLHTLDEVRALLTVRKIAFANAASQIDALAVDPRFVDQLIKMKADDVFVAPQPNNQIVVGHITGIRVDPVPNDLATRHATEYLRRSRVQETVQRQFGSVVQGGMKNVTYARVAGRLKHQGRMDQLQRPHPQSPGRRQLLRLPPPQRQAEYESSSQYRDKCRNKFAALSRRVSRVFIRRKDVEQHG